MKIVAVGECTRDRYVDRTVETVGGISLNFAVNARRCGAEHVAIVSCIGPDVAGDRIGAALAREGIDATH
ncbi:MAG: PfkB family carbohydrate kinase, partial [Gemmatimonadaceae bacterium]